MAGPPYHIARQEHVGDALDDLMARGVLRWRWVYDCKHRRAIYHLAIGDEPERPFGTAHAERAVLNGYAALGVKGLPVPHPGGERQREATLRRMAES